MNLAIIDNGGEQMRYLSVKETAKKRIWIIFELPIKWEIAEVKYGEIYG